MVYGITKKQLDADNPWIGNMEFGDSGYTAGDLYWSAERLYVAAEEQGCVPYSYPLRFLDMNASMANWGGERIVDVAWTARRVMKSDLRYPVLLGPNGNILDGFHRVAKAVALGLREIKVIRLARMPEPDEENDDD